MIAVVSAAAGLMAVAVSAHIAVVVPEPVKRAKRGNLRRRRLVVDGGRS